MKEITIQETLHYLEENLRNRANTYKRVGAEYLSDEMYNHLKNLEQVKECINS